MNSKGFTLMELLFLSVIVGIIAMAGYMLYTIVHFIAKLVNYATLYS